jgi:catechol 2,3-dioxygenase
MVTLPLDVEDLLAQSPNAPGPAVPQGTSIGHVHLKVSDVARAERFYRELGFEQQARLPAAAFVSAGGYHHHIGLNSWQSAGGSPAGADAPGLAAVDFALDGGGGLEALAGAAQALPGVERRDGALTVRDPDGHALRFNGS